MSTPQPIRAAARRAGLLAGTLAVAALAAPAGASAAAIVSDNWAGYVAHARSRQGFQSVSATWTVPAVSCTAPHQTHSAVWVGLGGYRTGAKALEQIGTAADCTGSGRAIYSSWLELLPAASSPLHLKVSPGDRVTASVTVLRRHVTLRLRDLTSGARYSTTLHPALVDVSSADWIVEAPSGCDREGSCRTLDLTDFGTVAFSNATATAAAHTGTLADSAWTTSQLVLRQRGASATGSSAGAPGGLVSATPSPYEGGSFAVLYAQTPGGRAPGAPTLP